MAKRQAKGVKQTGPETSSRDPYAAPPDANLYYIHPDLRQFAVRIDSLVFDPSNVKDHGDADLPSHQKSLRDFGIRRLVIGRKSNRQITAGNGTTAAAKRNGWDYVPAVFYDDDANKAQAFALVDNAIATLAPWDEKRVAELTKEALDWAGELDLDGLVSGILESCGAELEPEPEAEPEATPQPAAGSVPVGEVLVTRRVVVTCTSEKQQLELIAELQGRGFECDVSSRLAK